MIKLFGHIAFSKPSIIRNGLLKVALVMVFGLLSVGGAGAQVVIEEDKVELGVVYDAAQGGAYHDFVVENTSSKRIFILRAQQSPSADVKFSSKTIEPGSSEFIRVKYISRKKGRFMLNVPVYFSAMSKPIMLTLKGETQYTDTKASQACPSFKSKPYQKRQTSELIIEVVDAENNAPIEKAAIEYHNNPWQIKKELTDSKGKYSTKIELLGKYFFEAKKEGYQTQSRLESLHLGKNHVLFRLNKKVAVWPLTEELTILVKDKFTNAIISKADVVVLQQGKTQYNAKTNQSGIVFYPTYSSEKDYRIQASALDYSPVDDYRLTEYDKKDNFVTIYLEPIKKEKPVKTAKVITQTKEVSEPKTVNKVLSNLYKPNNIVFLIDKSSSMAQENRLNLLKSSMIELLTPLRAEDKVALIVYDTDVNILLSSTSAQNKALIAEQVYELSAGGLTAGVSGVEKAYELAENAFIQGGNNEVIVVTDGAFNMGGNNSKVVPKVKAFAEKGIRLSTIGVKSPYVVEDGLKKMAKYGNGAFVTIDSAQEAKTKLLDLIKEHSRK